MTKYTSEALRVGQADLQHAIDTWFDGCSIKHKTLRDYVEHMKDLAMDMLALKSTTNRDYYRGVVRCATMWLINNPK